MSLENGQPMMVPDAGKASSVILRGDVELQGLSALDDRLIFNGLLVKSNKSSEILASYQLECEIRLKFISRE